MLRIGLAGLGVHGARYAAHLLKGDVPGARLAAVSRRDVEAGERFADENDLEFVADPRDLARHTGIDAVAVALRPDLHAAVLESCIEAGTPVLVEKPMTADSGSAARLAARATSLGSPVMVAQTLRFDAVVNAIRADIPSLGRIHLISVGQFFESRTRSWIDDPGAGGALINTAVHGVDLLRYLTGAEPVSVTAETGRALTRHTEDRLSMTVRLEPGGILGSVCNSRTTEARGGRVEVIAEKGILAGDFIRQTVRRFTGRNEEVLGPIFPVHTVEEALRAFVECVTEDLPFPVTVEDGRIAVEMVEAARRSAESGERVYLARR